MLPFVAALLAVIVGYRASRRWVIAVWLLLLVALYVAVAYAPQYLSYYNGLMVAQSLYFAFLALLPGYAFGRLVDWAMERSFRHLSLLT
ncbi:MAG: hypothetical protein Q7R74_00790 [bacterium]|nr:hypothetical protein [bacterium]